MEPSMERWYEAIRKRVSVRKYSRSVSRDELLTLKEAAQYFSTDDVRIIVGKKDGMFDPIIGKTISGTDTFAAIISRGDDNDYMVGTVGEAFVLECTALGYGTCWMTSANHTLLELEEVIPFRREKHRLVALVPMGIPEGERKSPAKLPIEEIFTVIK